MCDLIKSLKELPNAIKRLGELENKVTALERQLTEKADFTTELLKRLEQLEQGISEVKGFVQGHSQTTTTKKTIFIGSAFSPGDSYIGDKLN